MSFIFKIYENNNNIYSRVFIFVNHLLTSRDLSIEGLYELFTKEPKNLIFQEIFTDLEISQITETKTEVIFVDAQIHLDDTVETIKKKIIENDPSIAFEEIYLYGRKKVKFDNVEIYQKLTQNNRLDLTRERLMQFLLNIDFDAEAMAAIFAKIGDKEIYDYNDFLSLNLDRQEYIENIPIGQSFVASESNFIYTVNPFDVLMYDVFLEKYADVITSTANKAILLDCCLIYENSIYFCIAKPVLEYNIAKSLSEQSCLKIYFPFLYEDTIYNLESLERNREKFLEKNNKLIGPVFDQKNEIINMFYNLDDASPIEKITYIERGIKSIEFVIHPPISFNIPIDVIFKILHATNEIPLIKYNPGIKQENIYRLYATQISKDGRKIPYLSKGTIFKLIKSIGKSKRVALYIEFHPEDADEIIPITCEFDSNASIYVSMEFKSALDLDHVNELINHSINPVINHFKLFLEQSGYTISNFLNLHQSNIQILNMSYYLSAQIKTFKLLEYKVCVSELFNIISDKLDKGIEMRFKRVSNYNEMDSLEAFIMDLLNRGVNHEEVIEKLEENFKLSKDEARMKLAELISSLQVVQNLYQNKKFKIKKSPGFLTFINRNKYGAGINIQMDNINNINYLETVPFLLNSLLILCQSDPKKAW